MSRPTLPISAPRWQTIGRGLRHLFRCALLAALFVIAGCASQEQHKQIMEGIENTQEDLAALSKTFQEVHREAEQLSSLSSAVSDLKVKMESIEAAIKIEGQQAREAFRSELAAWSAPSPDSEGSASSEDVTRAVQALRTQVESLAAAVRNDGMRNRQTLEENSQTVRTLTGSVGSLTRQVATSETQVQAASEQSVESVRVGLDAVNARFLCSMAILKEIMKATGASIKAVDEALRANRGQSGAAGPPSSPVGAGGSSATSDVEKFCEGVVPPQFPSSPAGGI